MFREGKVGGESVLHFPRNDLSAGEGEDVFGWEDAFLSSTPPPVFTKQDFRRLLGLEPSHIVREIGHIQISYQAGA